jgi:ESCRT-II complex subunit VPS36
LHLSQQNLGLKFEESDTKEEFLSLMNNAILKRSWENVKLTSSSSISIGTTTTVFQNSAQNLGVGGVILRQERELQSVQKLSKDAVQDMESLMRQAKEVVTMVQRYAGYMAEQSTSLLSDGTASESGEINEMNEILQDIGIVSPVTRYTAGKLYHQELARQIADILIRENRLKRMGGMITLPDAYCLVNKARGTEPVSPDDLYHASQIIGSLRIGIKLKTFDTGVLVLQLDNMSDDHICVTLMNMYNTMLEIKEQGLHTALVARYLNLSIVVAKQYLLLAESLGYLCRDESSQGTFFFPNKFL